MGVLMVDPPWQFEDDYAARGANKKYDCLSLEELKRFPIPRMAKASILVLWRVGSQVEEAYELGPLKSSHIPLTSFHFWITKRDQFRSGITRFFDQIKSGVIR